MKAVLVLAAIVALTVVASPTATEAAADDYEVWVADQGLHLIHIFEPSGNPAGSDLTLVDTIDFNAEGAALGVPLLQPHMILFGLHGRPGSRYGYVGNMGSGNSVVIDAEAREIAAVFHTGDRTHAVQPSPDGTRALSLVLGPASCPLPPFGPAPDCGAVVEILTDTTNGVFTLGRSFTFADFASHPKAHLLPRFNPVCGSFTPDSAYFYVTLSSGGFVIFKVNADPSMPLFDVVDVWPSGTESGEIAPNGCGLGYSVDGQRMFANSGQTAASGGRDFYYVFDIATHTLVKSVEISDVVTDVHGMMLTPDGKDVVMAGRLSHNFIVIDQKTGNLRPQKTFNAAPGETPDLTDFSPDGKWLYVSNRGPNPATGTHAVAGNTPGVTVVRFAAGKVERVVPLPGNVAQQDPHGLAVRRLEGGKKPVTPKGPPIVVPPVTPGAGGPPSGLPFGGQGNAGGHIIIERAVLTCTIEPSWVPLALWVGPGLAPGSSPAASVGPIPGTL